MSAESEAEREERGLNRGINRRRALQILGAVPVATALGAQQQQAPQQNKVLTPGVTSQIPVAPGSSPLAPPQTHRFFTPHEFKTASLLSDYIIPKDEHSGSATDAKVPEYMDFLLSEKDANVNTQIAMRGGLAWLDNECRKRFGKTFLDARDVQRREVLDDIAYPAKAPPAMSYGVSFFNRFRDMTASGFYSSAIGWQDVKYVGNVFNPAYDGCPPAALAKLGVSLDMMKTRVAPEAK